MIIFGETTFENNHPTQAKVYVEFDVYGQILIHHT